MSVRALAFTRADINDNFQCLWKSSNELSFSVLDIHRLRTEMYIFVKRIRKTNDQCSNIQPKKNNPAPESTQRCNIPAAKTNSVFRPFRGHDKDYNVDEVDNNTYLPPRDGMVNGVTVDLPTKM